jgi:hypothetical protein
MSSVACSSGAQGLEIENHVPRPAKGTDRAVVQFGRFWHSPIRIRVSLKQTTANNNAGRGTVIAACDASGEKISDNTSTT